MATIYTPSTSGTLPIYPAAGSNFQAKVWVGGNNNGDAEYQDGKVKAVVAYLRSMDNEIKSNGKIPDNSDYQLQQWRNVLPLDSISYDDKRQLDPLSSDPSLWETNHLRTPRTSSTPPNLILNIDTAKFKDNDGSNYEYLVISLEKLEYKLYLLSRFVTHYPEPTDNYTYTHIEEDLLPNEKIFDDIGFDHVDGELMHEERDNNPVIVGPEPLPASGLKTVTVPGQYYDLEENPSVYRPNTDFILVIRPTE